MFVRRAYACPVCGEGFAKWSICQNHVNTSVTCCTILGDRLKIQEELQELCRGAANGDFIHLAAPEAPVEVPVEVPVLPMAPAPLPLTTLVPAPVPMPVGPVRPVSENAGFQWQASSEKLLYSRSTKPQLTNEVNFDDWMPPNLDEHVTLRLHHALQTGYLSKEEQQPLWKSLQQLVDHQPEEQRLVIQKFLGPTYDDFREIVNKPMWLLRCIEHCRRSSARSERVTATVNNERLWAALDGHGLGESDLTEECWNTFGLFPPPLQETVLEAVRQSLLLKTEKNPSRFFTELCVNEEAVYNLEARRGDADEAVQVQPAQGTWESFSDSRYHELLRQLLLNTRNAEHQVLQVLSEDLPGSSGLLQVHLATQDARREGSAELLSLLHAAAANGLARLCARLIAEGFDVNERTGHQLFSPLHLAASNGVLAATELLLAKGAQAWLLDDSGKTPLYHVVTTLPEAKASEQQLLLRIAQQLVLGMLQASEMDELLVESALEILQQSELTWLLQLHHRLRNLQRKNQQIFTPPKLAELGRMRYETLNMLLAFFDGPEKCRLTVPDEALALEFSAVMSSEFIQEQEQLRKKVNVMAKVLDLSRPLIAMLSALPFKAAEHAMNCFQIEERAPCVYAALLPDNDKEESDPGEEEVRTLNLSGDVKRTVGILHKWENERGFGFIHDENDTSDPPLDIFVHRTNLMGCAPGYPVDLQEGRRICYIPGFQDGRTRAMSAAMIDEDFNVDPVHLRRPRKAKAAEQSKERKIAKLKEAIEREEHPLSKSFMQFLATAEMQEVIQEKRQEGEAWLRCLGLLRQPPGGKRDDILWRKEIDRRVDIFLDLKTSPLTKKDIDYRCKRILTEFCMRSSAVRVSEALAMLEKSTSGKRREEVRSWPAYVATLLRRFDPEMTAQMEKKPKEKAEPKKEKETNESPGREEEKDSGSSSEPPEASTAPAGAAFAFQ